MYSRRVSCVVLVAASVVLAASTALGLLEQQIPGASGGHPDACMDHEGNIHFVWISTVQAASYARYDRASQQWSTPVRLPQGHDVWYNFGPPKVAVGPDLRPHVVWLTYPDLTAFRYARALNREGTQWQVTTMGYDWRAYIDIAVDPQNEPHFAFQRVLGEERQLIYRSPWGGERVLSRGWEHSARPTGPSIKVDAGGIVHIAWWKGEGYQTRADILYANSTNWDNVTNISNNPWMWWPRSPRMAVSPATGNVEAIVYFNDNWSGGDGYREGIWDWGTQIWGCHVEEDTDIEAEVAIDASGHRYVVWRVYAWDACFYKIDDQSTVELPTAGGITVAAGANGAVAIRARPDGGSFWWVALDGGAVDLEPTAVIDGIVPDSAYAHVDTVSFWGSAWDNDEGGSSIVAYEWESDLDGLLALSEDFSLLAAELSAGTHTITFRAEDDEGDWGQDTETLVVVSGDSPPAPVTDLEAFDTPQDQGGSVTLTWSKSTDDGAYENDVATYRVERRLQTAFLHSPIAEVAPGTEECADTTTQDSVWYFYRLVTVDSLGQETPCSEVGPVMSYDDWVTPPSGFVAIDAPGDQGGRIELSWTLSSEDGAGVDDVLGYAILREEGGNPGYVTLDSLSPGTDGYVDSSVTDLALYSYVVSVWDDAGNQGDSDALSAVPHDNIAPAPPADVKGQCVGLEGWAFLSWQLSADDTAGGVDDVVWYAIRQSTPPGSPYATIDSVPAGSDYYLDRSTIPGTTYLYVIVALDGENASANSEEVEILATGTSGPEDSPVPRDLVLAQAGPNPVRKTLTVTYGLPSAAEITLTLHNLLGQTVAVLDRGTKPAGFHTVSWRTDGGSVQMQPGTFVLVLESDGRRLTRRLVAAQ